MNLPDRSRSGYIRVTHPATGRFLFEYDPERDLVLVVDRGKEALLDLAQYKEAQNDDKVQSVH